MKRLTKSFFLSLMPGLYWVSCECTRTGEPFFEGFVAVEQRRGEQWNEIKIAGVDYRNCRVFRSRSHFECFRKLLCTEQMKTLLNIMAASGARNN